MCPAGCDPRAGPSSGAERELGKEMAGPSELNGAICKSRTIDPGDHRHVLLGCEVLDGEIHGTFTNQS